MKVTSVELQPYKSINKAVLSFKDPGRKNPYNVKNIMGLDADEIVPRYYGGSGLTKFFELTLQTRVIVLRIVLNPRPELGESVASLRDNIYKLIGSSRTGELDIQFKDGNSIVATISGFVSKMEAPQFNKEPEVQITVNCDDPMLKAPNRVDLDVASISSSLGYIRDSYSTAPHGFVCDINVITATPSLTLSDPNDPTWSFVVAPTGGFLAGDVLHVSSEYNNKSIYLTRTGNTIYLADKVARASIWPLLFPEENLFALTPSANFSWKAVSYYPTYWGV